MIVEVILKGRKTSNPIPCPAVVMDPSVLGTCWGEWHLDHVKDEARMGLKAEDDERNLVNLCAVHDERGMKGGYQWNTAHRAEEREYLRGIYGPDQTTLDREPTVAEHPG